MLYRANERHGRCSLYNSECADTIVNMERLARRLKEARSRHGMTLEVASGAAKISPAYLHKLEAGRVMTPSPHVLRRLAAVFGVPYATLMTLAGYLDDEGPAAGAEEAPDHASGTKERPMAQSTRGGDPTNAEIVRLLQAVQAELGELKRGQNELVKRLGKAAPRKTSG
jgi:transcriptional regulator with XRE-family HTH domain